MKIDENMLEMPAASIFTSSIGFNVENVHLIIIAPYYFGKTESDSISF